MAQPKRKPPRLTLTDVDDAVVVVDPDRFRNTQLYVKSAAVSEHGSVHPPPAMATAAAEAAAATSPPAPWSPIQSQNAGVLNASAAPSVVSTFLSTLHGSSTNDIASAPSSAQPNAIVGSTAAHDTTHSTRRHVAADKYKKRGRVESVNLDELPSGRVSHCTHTATNNHHNVASSSRVSCHHHANNNGAFIPMRSRRGLPRSHSTPNLLRQTDTLALTNIFPDINPRHLRIAEVKSWHCAWMRKAASAPTQQQQRTPTSPSSPAMTISPRSLLPLLRFPRLPATASSPQMVTPNVVRYSNTMAGAVATGPETPQALRSPRTVTHRPAVEELDDVIHALANELALEDKPPATLPLSPAPPAPVKVSTPTLSPPVSRRPQLRLKLEDMPTPQQAEDRAQRAANRLIAKREAIERASATTESSTVTAAAVTQTNATQSALLRLTIKSFSSGDDDSDVQSPTDAGRHSAGSAYSPNHGMFTTKSVHVSEAGIASPDAACLHLQENLEKVCEVGRGASGIVYKAIHIPTLKVVAIKDVPVYGRGQRRQMVRELHALYSNLVPISTSSSGNGDKDDASASATRSTSSPYIVSFYDAFVDRPKNSICLVMEFMSTGSLQDIVLHGGCTDEKILARLSLGVLRGLAHIHRKNMLHRDIKPHNLLTNRRGDVKISDFGLARTLNDHRSSAKTFVGTLLYMAPERIGGGDYSYPADIWSFGLALISVAIGKYPLPTQDGFFGLVDSVANEKLLELPADRFSPECRAFVQECVRIDPTARPSAHELLSHPFVTKYSPDETLAAWTSFIEEKQLCEDRNAEVASLADAVYRHIYERCVKSPFQPQSDYGVSFLAQATTAFSRRQVTIEPVQMSLQLGLANVLGVPAATVYEQFELKRNYYSDKLLEEYCYSPQSWTASPGDSRRQQLFGSDSESPGRPTERLKNSFWRKLQSSMAKLGSRRKRKGTADAAEANANAGGGGGGENAGGGGERRTTPWRSSSKKWS